MDDISLFLKMLKFDPVLVQAGPVPVEQAAGLAGAQLPMFAQGAEKPPKKTVKARQRRRSGSEGPEDDVRAAAPKRQRERQPGPPSGGGSQPPGMSPRPMGGGLPGGRLPRWMVVALVIIFVVFFLPSLFSEDSGGLDELLSAVPTSETGSFAPTEPLPVEEFPVEPTAAPEVIAPPPAASGDGQTWLVMLYQDADDKILEQDIYLDFNEAERVGSSDRVQIVAQVDRYRAGFTGDGDWSGTRRYHVRFDSDLHRVNSQLVQDIGEVNMSDGAQLVDFVTWAVDRYPADKYVLILSDHGMGWPGGWSDPDPGGRGIRSIPLADQLGDELYLMELDESLETIRAQSGIDQFELIGMDACLMGHLEVFSALAPHARYAVASQETEPALGWAYTQFLASLLANPDMNGGELGRLIVDSYIRGDQRITDDQARAEFLSKGSPLGGLFSLFGGGGLSADQMAQQMARNTTLTAVDLASVPDLMGRVNELSFALQEADQADVAQARNYAQSFTSVFGRDVPPSYIDLGNFVQLLKQESGDRNVDQAADGVLAAIQTAVIAETHGPNKPGATGISIYFPSSQLYKSPVTGPQSYTAIADRFASESLWDEFLAFHYTGGTFDARSTGIAAVPSESTPVRAPGAGRIEVTPIELGSQFTAPGQPVTLRSDITGENIGYIYFFVGFYDRAANSIAVVDNDYLESESIREIGGVYYPDWGAAGEFTLEFEWEPVVFAIEDGSESVVTVLNPERYGAAPDEAVYTVDGVYAYADGGETRYARLYFSDGSLRHVFGFTGENGTGAPREIIPQTGDTFTIMEKWMDLDQTGRVAEVAGQPGGTLTFGDQMFTWREIFAAPGEYVIGFIVEDLDGNPFSVFAPITVE